MLFLVTINSNLDLVYEAEQLAYDGDIVGFEAILNRLNEKQLNVLISILVK